MSNLERFIERQLGELADERDGLVASLAETFDLWKLREAEASRLRSALESIQFTLKQGFGYEFMLNRVESLVSDALAENQVADDEGATT